jgi:hypothetical protein
MILTNLKNSHLMDEFIIDKDIAEFKKTLI